MKFTEIRESGANNTLMWALSNGAVLSGDQPLLSIINDEMFYLITLSDINFFELFRLTQMYRDKLRILNSKQSVIPSEEELTDHFKGETSIDDETIPLYKVAENSIQRFLDLVDQMSSDDDIIHAGAARLFIPMINRRFDVQIPVSFYDLFMSMNDTEVSELFNSNYPNTLANVVTSEVHGIKNVLGIGFVKGTQIIRYDSRYDKYLKATKYFPLASDDGSRLYKIGLLGFSKRDLVARTEVRFSLFKVNKEQGLSTMKRLSKLNTPLEVDFAIQLPLEYMQLLESSYGRETLKIQYESSMSNILDAGINYNDFKISTWKDSATEENEEEMAQRLEEHDNSISAYKIRIAEANEVMLKSIQVLLSSSGEEVNSTSIFSLLPSIYPSTAVITIPADNIKIFTSHPDPLLASMFNQIAEVIMQLRRSEKSL